MQTWKCSLVEDDDFRKPLITIAAPCPTGSHLDQWRSGWAAQVQQQYALQQPGRASGERLPLLRMVLIQQRVTY